MSDMKGTTAQSFAGVDGRWDMDGRVRSIVIVGGGTAGWMSAAAIAATLGSSGLEIILVESEEITPVGVGEATLPHIRFFNNRLGIDEADLMAATQATYKLGIEFCDWGRIGDSYIHPFGDFGFPISRVDFHHYVSRAAKAGAKPDLDEFSLPVQAARMGRFQKPHPNPESILSTFGYAYQLDAGLYARYLRRFCEARGLTRLQGTVEQVIQNEETGTIRSLRLSDGRIIEGDYFVDCTGFRALLIGEVMGSKRTDWSHWLPCNRAVTVQTEVTGDPDPFTRATAKPCGWQWRIPLQHRNGNGLVYSSDHMTDEVARDALLESLDAPLRNQPKTLRFATGYRPQGWSGNCVAIGLSGGFLEPLESTGLYLIQEAVTNFVELFPTRKAESVVREEFNRIMSQQFERVRDFLLLHYVATERDDSEFWRQFHRMELPESLSFKMDLFRQSGRIVEYEIGAFKDPSWIAVYFGQGIVPQGYDPLVDRMSSADLPRQLNSVRMQISAAASSMTRHVDSLSGSMAE